MPTHFQDVDIGRIQIIAIIGSFLFVAFILELIRKKRLKEAYALLWLIFGGVFLLLSIFRNFLDTFSWSFGIAYPPAALFLVAIISFLLVLVQFSVVISKQHDKIKELSQELGLLDVKEPGISPSSSTKKEKYVNP